jgi:hypothetical protein
MLMETEAALTDEHVYLTGRPPLSAFVRFVRTRGVDGLRIDDEALAREWQRARERVSEIEREEAGWANAPALTPLPYEMQVIADAEMQREAVQRATRYVPHRWCMVELDRLVVFQKWVNLKFVADIQAALPESPSNEDLIRVAVGKARPLPAVQVAQNQDNSYSFASSSVDLRFLDVVPLDPTAIQGYQPSGYASHVIGIFVGFGINFLSACHVDGRLILSNGSHRAYALRDLGFTHCPCLVSQVTSDAEFELVASAEMKQARDQYARSPRPPLFKDYFDPRLRKIVKVPRTNQLLQLQLALQRTGVPVV